MRVGTREVMLAEVRPARLEVGPRSGCRAGARWGSRQRGGESVQRGMNRQPVVEQTRRVVPQKVICDGGRGVAAHSISPRPLARAREICVPTFSDKVAVSAPALMASALASRRQSSRAAGPSPPVVSTPNGEKSQPAAWQTDLLWTTLARSASATADERPSRHR